MNPETVGITHVGGTIFEGKAALLPVQNTLDKQLTAGNPQFTTKFPCQKPRLVVSAPHEPEKTCGNIGDAVKRGLRQLLMHRLSHQAGNGAAKPRLAAELIAQQKLARASLIAQRRYDRQAVGQRCQDTLPGNLLQTTGGAYGYALCRKNLPAEQAAVGIKPLQQRVNLHSSTFIASRRRRTRSAV